VKARPCVWHCSTVTGIRGPVLRSRTWCTTRTHASSPVAACTQPVASPRARAPSRCAARTPPSRRDGAEVHSRGDRGSLANATQASAKTCSCKIGLGTRTAKPTASTVGFELSGDGRLRGLAVVHATRRARHPAGPAAGRVVSGLAAAAEVADGRVARPPPSRSPLGHAARKLTIPASAPANRRATSLLFHCLRACDVSDGGRLCRDYRCKSVTRSRSRCRWR
jgi:hypothetical protein